MRVLVLTSQYPSSRFPNRAAFNRQHLDGLSKLADVEVICPIPWVEQRRAGWKSPSELQNSPFATSYPTYWYPPRLLRRFYGHFMKASLWGHLLRRAQAFEPDVVLGIWAYPEGRVAVDLGRHLEVPVAVQVLGSDVNMLDEFPAKKEPTFSALRSADIVLPVSQALKKIVVDEGVERERVRVVYRGVNRELFYPRDQNSCRAELSLDRGKKIILFAGNLVSVKAVDVLVKAFAALQMGQSVQLHVLGNGTLRGDLERLSQQLGCSPQVYFHGVVDHHELPVWFGAADLVALPSLAEGVPNVLLEARSCSRPYVASAVGGIPEISDHPMASLVPPGNVNALTKALSTRLSSGIELSEVEPWRSWETAAADLGAALESIC